MPAYTQPYKNLSWCSLTQEQHAKTCGYWYTVMSSGTSHTAFATRESFLSWAGRLGLTVDAAVIPLAGTHGYGAIGGEYRRASHIGTHADGDPLSAYVGGYDEFFALRGERIRCMDNADVTLGIITVDDDGVRTLHHLNCNMRDRPVFPRDRSTIEGY